MMHGLEEPLERTGSSVETDHRLTVQVVAFASAAIPVVARRAYREIDEATRIVDAERRPDIRVTGRLPASLLPGLRRRLGITAWNRTPSPHPFSGAHIERLHVPRRIVGITQRVRDSVADDDQVMPHDRRRGLRVVELVDRFPKLRRE